MAALQCEICGGKLIGRPGGIFECDSCGMEYDTAWAKEKIQEIKGTVKVEGTVEVTGTVQVSGSVTLDSLLKRGFSELSDQNVNAAMEAFDRAMDIDARCGDIYVGQLMCKNKIWNRAVYRSRLMDHDWDDQVILSKIMSCSGSDIHAREVSEYCQMLREETAQRAENARRGQERAQELKRLRERYAPILRRISEDGRAALDSDGTLYFLQEGISYITDNRDYPRWKNLISISGCGELIVTQANGRVEAGVGFWTGGRLQFERIEAFSPDDNVVQTVVITAKDSCLFAGLKEDGSVITSKYRLNDWESEELKFKADWNNIVQLQARGKAIIGLSADGVVQGVKGHVPEIASINEGWFLKTDGTVISTSDYPGYRNRIQNWSDIIQISGDSDGTAAVKSDGTVVYTDYANNRITRERRKEVAGWKDIVAVRVYSNSILGVKSDGSLVTAGPVFASFVKEHPGFRIFRDLDSLADEQRQRRESAFIAWKEEEKKQNAEMERFQQLRQPLEAELARIHAEMANLKGLFSMKRRKELENRMGIILLELDELKMPDSEED